MYSGKINGEPTTFGTSGFLYRSNKLMYDRLTESIWHQFTGEPVIGPLAHSGIVLPFFPSLLTTWQEWVEEHPHTTVLAQETGSYPASFYVAEWDRNAIYYSYRNSPSTIFPVWNLGADLPVKDVVLGLGIGDSFKAYAVSDLQKDRVVNDSLGGTDVVIVASPTSQAARAYLRASLVFATVNEDSTAEGLPSSLVDADGGTWQVTGEFLVSDADPARKLERLPTTTSFWFGWSSFHPDTELYSRDGE